MANKRNGTLYTGVTSNLIKRIYEHRNEDVESFVHRFMTYKLVYYELHGDMYTAITREKNVKKWKRKWKLELIESLNPEWKDLYDEIIL